MLELGQYAIPIFFAYGISLLLIVGITLVSYIQYKSVMRNLQKIEED
ncbi:MAG: heme exporter protein CcmD [Rhodobacteraceae bacterium]|nr:MAG: heme exporter protein CcmD [Paracoccaceae bacterium]